MSLWIQGEESRVRDRKCEREKEREIVRERETDTGRQGDMGT